MRQEDWWTLHLDLHALKAYVDQATLQQPR